MAVTYSTWWVSLLIFIPYAMLLYLAHWSYRRHVFQHTLLIIVLFCCVTPFYFYPIGTETYIILKYFVVPLFVRIQAYKQIQLTSDFQRLMYKRSATSCCYSERTMFLILYLLCVLNLFDSILIEYLNAHFVNSLCGIVLCASMPIPKRLAYPVHEWSVEARTGWHTLCVRFRPGWVAVYTSWNLCFVYTLFPAHFVKHGLIVVIPLATAALGDQGLDGWLSARLYTQSLFYFGYLLICAYRVTAQHLMSARIDEVLQRHVLEHIGNDLFIDCWAALNFVAGVLYAVWWFRWVCRQNAKKYRVLQTEDDMDAEFGDFDDFDDEEPVAQEEEDQLQTELANAKHYDAVHV